MKPSALSEHTDDIERMYFEQGQSYQEIGDKFGRSREAIRQFLNRHFSDKVRGRDFRSQWIAAERAESDAAEERQRVEDAPKCVICFDPVTRRTGGRGDNRTCSPEHSDLWAQARFLLDPVLREKQRQSMAKSILNHPDKHVDSAKRWAEKVRNGETIEARTYVRKDSQARRAYDEVMRIRAEKGRM